MIKRQKSEVEIEALAINDQKDSPTLSFIFNICDDVLTEIFLYLDLGELSHNQILSKYGKFVCESALSAFETVEISKQNLETLVKYCKKLKVMTYVDDGDAFGDVYDEKRAKAVKLTTQLLEQNQRSLREFQLVFEDEPVLEALFSCKSLQSLEFSVLLWESDDDDDKLTVLEATVLRELGPRLETYTFWDMDELSSFLKLCPNLKHAITEFDIDTIDDIASCSLVPEHIDLEIKYSAVESRESVLNLPFPNLTRLEIDCYEESPAPVTVSALKVELPRMLEFKMNITHNCCSVNLTDFLSACKNITDIDISMGSEYSECCDPTELEFVQDLVQAAPNLTKLGLTWLTLDGIVALKEANIDLQVLRLYIPSDGRRQCRKVVEYVARKDVFANLKELYFGAAKGCACFKKDDRSRAVREIFKWKRSCVISGCVCRQLLIGHNSVYERKGCCEQHRT